MKRITLAPGDAAWLDDTLARNRSLFAGWRMEKDGDDEEEVEVGDEGDDDDGDKGEDDDPDAGKDEETLRKELRESREALKKANAESKKRRLREKERRQEGDGEKKGDGRDVAAEVEAKWKPRVVNAAAKSALAEAGAKKPDRLLRLVDLAELDVDDDGDVDGLDEEVERLREEYPELFAGDDDKKTGRRKVETGDRKSGAGRTQTATERQAGALLGRNR